MSLTSQQTAAQDATFKAQVKQGAITYAQTVAAEGSGVTGHQIRAGYANRVLNQTGDELFAAIAQAVVTDGTTTTGATDAAILARIEAVWDALAGSL